MVKGSHGELGSQMTPNWGGGGRAATVSWGPQMTPNLGGGGVGGWGKGSHGEVGAPNLGFGGLGEGRPW